MLIYLFSFFFVFPVCQTSVDLAFILDSSGSVGSSNFNKVKNFVKNVVDFFNIGSSGTHVAVVTYSTYSSLEFKLKAHYTKSSIKNAVSEIRYRGGWTYTADALDFTRKNIFSKSQVSRVTHWVELKFIYLPPTSPSPPPSPWSWHDHSRLKISKSWQLFWAYFCFRFFGVNFKGSGFLLFFFFNFCFAKYQQFNCA